MFKNGGFTARPSGSNQAPIPCGPGKVPRPKPNPQKTNKDPLDRYYTPAWVTEILVENWPFPESVCWGVWEPCAGERHISKVLRESGVAGDVWSSDIKGTSAEFDFLKGNLADAHPYLTRRLADRTVAIVTNPPYSIPGATAADFVRKALEYTPYVAMLMRLDFASKTKDRSELFENNPPSKILIISPRVAFTGPVMDGKPDRPNGTSAWFIWEPGTTQTVVEWVSRNEQ